MAQNDWLGNVGSAASGMWTGLGPVGQLGLVGGLLSQSGLFNRKRKPDNEMEAMKAAELSDFSQQQGLGGLIGTYGREDYRRGTADQDRGVSGYMDALMNPAVYDAQRAKFAADRAKMMDAVSNRVGTMGGAGQAARVAAQMTAYDPTTAAAVGQTYGNQQGAKANAFNFLAQQGGARRQMGLGNMVQGGNIASRATNNLLGGMRYRKNLQMQQAANQGKFMSGLGSTLGTFAGLKYGNNMFGGNGTGTTS
jgi:hypothetical protein